MEGLKTLNLGCEPNPIEKQAASFLKSLNETACVEYCKAKGIPSGEILPAVIEGSAKAMECLTCFIQAGVWLGYLIDNPVWEQVLVDSTEPEYAGLIHAVRSLYSRECDLLVYRAAYRYGKPIMIDAAYDNLLNIYGATYPQLAELKGRSYDDDVYPSALKDLLFASGICTAQKVAELDKPSVSREDSERRERLKKDLGSAKSTSVRPVLSYEDTWEFIQNSSADLQFSLKVDGVNCKACFEDGVIGVALSRGRSADSLDYTDSLRKILPERIEGIPDGTTITGEGYVSEKYLSTLRLKYPNKEFKTPKSTAMSMLRATHHYDEEDLSNLRWICYYADPLGQHAGEMFDKLEALGIETPPRILVKRSEVPTDFEEFKVWLKVSILDPLWEKGESLEIPSDGVVCDLLESIQTERKDQYNDHNIALKFEQWDAATYESTVVKILIEQRRVFASVVLEIEPVTTRDLNVATRVNVGSPAILIEDRIVPGSKIKFVRKSEAINVYVRG